MTPIEPFASLLLQWHELHARDLPWKSTSDPYKIWLSEVILQQTRVDQGTPYYYRFIENFPDIFALANAPEDEVLKLWEGLGYYSRARNMHHAAKTIVKEHHGVFPKTYNEVLALKGIGPYTAAAIMSFAFNAPYPVIDGNVIRVLSRYHGITEAVDTTPIKKQLVALAESHIKGVDPGQFNQAIMDFGALQCVPKNPNCSKCPFMFSCVANQKKMQSVIPLKSKKVKIKPRYIHYFIFLDDDYTLIRKRNKNDIWKGLYEFISVETQNSSSIATDVLLKSLPPIPFQIKNMKKVGKFKHVLTHRHIFATFYILKVRGELHPEIMKKYDIQRVHKDDIQEYAFPRLIQKNILEKNIL